MGTMTFPRTLAGRYELVQAIGRGGMGQVWSALDPRLQRQVAVKTVDLGHGADPVVAQRFQQEAQATAALNSPHIVTIFDSGVDGDTAFIVMELLRGPSLEEVVRADGALPVDRALDYAGQVASALAVAHAAGIVHRDIKPSNLMLDGRGGIKVVDFGIARLDQERSSKLTATATVVGSAPYLSPEQATGGVATAQSDLYSLGCVLVTLLTGEPPFAGEHPLSVLHQHLSSPPPLPSSRRPEVGAAVDQLVAQLLAKSPADRPASARDVADRIQAIRRGHLGGGELEPAGDAPTAVMAPVPAPVPRPAAVPREARPAATAPREERRSGGLAGWVVAAVLVLALLAGGLYLLLGGRDDSTSTPTDVRTVTQTATAPAPSSSQPTTTSETPVPTTTVQRETVTPTATRTTATATASETPTPEPTTTSAEVPSATATPSVSESPQEQTTEAPATTGSDATQAPAEPGGTVQPSAAGEAVEEPAGKASLEADAVTQAAAPRADATSTDAAP